MTATRRRILLGEISGAHGIRGEVLIRSYAGAPEAIGAYGPLEDESGTRTLALTVVRTTPRGVVARVEGCDDRNAAEKLKGLKLYVERAKLGQAGEDEFFHADLVGLTVTDPGGVELGAILAVANYGAGDLLEIRLKDSKQTELVPLTKAHVPHIDIAGGTAIVIMPEMSAVEEEPYDLEADEADPAIESDDPPAEA